MMLPLLQILVYPLFVLLRICIHGFRNVLWWADGTHDRLLESRKEDNYGMSVHVLSIWGRRKLDVIGCCNFLSDFVLFHEGFDDPNTLLRSEVSLYCITPREFVFVQCAEGDTAWDVRDYSFSREAQFRKAQKVMVLPIHAAHHLAATLRSRPRERVIFIPNTARCGSTLVCQIFQATGKCVAYSEPNALADLLKFATRPGDAMASQLILTTLTLLCKPTGHSVEAHVIKMQPYQTTLIPALAESCPGARFVFLYRGIQATCASYIKLFVTLPVGILAGLSKAIHAQRLWMNFLANHGILNPNQPPLVPKIFAAKPTGMYAEVSLTPLLAMREYLFLRQRGYDISAIRYEDITSNTDATLNELFNFCGLSLSLLQPAMLAFDRDSQAHSPVCKGAFIHFYVRPFTETDIREIDEMCEELALPNLTKGCALPGTMSMCK